MVSKKSNKIADLTAAELSALYAARELSPVEAVRASLERIGSLNSEVNAYNFIDEETTLALAARSEERWRIGTPLGPVDGVPLAIKDMFPTRGWPNRKGSKIIPADPGEVDAPAVAAARRNGLIPLGRTTTPEFAWKAVTDSALDGVTTNPWDPSKVSGGSSGGSAAAVALGMGPLALGTDGGGSIRIPAAFCGVVGHKPTHGLCPMWPPSSFAPLAHVGPIAWTVADSALLLDVLAVDDPRDTTLPARRPAFYRSLRKSDMRGQRIAFSADLGYVDVAPEVKEAVSSAVRLFEDGGGRVEALDPGFDDPLEPFNVLFYGGAANALRSIDEGDRAKMDPALVEVAEWASGLSMLDYLAAMNERAALIERMNHFHESWDLLVTPTLPIPAFDAGKEVPEGWPHKRWPTWTPFTYPFNMTGQPAVTLPCGFTREGLPIGLQIVGARHDDRRVLQAAHYLQQAKPLTAIRPDLVAEKG